VFYKKIWETILDRKNWRGEICNKNKDGKLIWFLSLISPIFDTRGELVHYLYVAEDITEKKNKEDVMIHQTLHDNLTGLPNRALFKDRLMQLLERYSRFEKKNYIGVMFIDLDKFKPVNDTMGHEAGDVVLKIVSERMANSLRKEDTVARVGGDEFAVITPDLPDVEQASKLAAKVLEAICQPMKIQDREVGISACIGIALYPKDGDDYNTLLIKADKTMYRMKRSTDNKIAFYDDSV
jgi:diguanylate cyclase (GGDEF)-like protein